MHIDDAGAHSASHEETFHGLEIYIEANSDQYRGGFSWSICCGENELDCGHATSAKNALAEARKAIEDMEGQR